MKKKAKKTDLQKKKLSKKKKLGGEFYVQTIDCVHP